MDAAVDPVEEEVVVAFVTRRTFGPGVGEGVCEGRACGVYDFLGRGVGSSSTPEVGNGGISKEARGLLGRDLDLDRDDFRPSGILKKSWSF